ncbi:hypothetical protein [Thermoflavimicrobium daqui]|jgi:hypothetical protein|uniref:DUF4825 domain-containing protein n=1 Tax=Thermoflavimicrobium daqui TaxID=2137476 RepID=A0A364K2M3_9BACL|nr:hypothetical protein [Thermoflavimicrobium daqui]RAL22637.1 hypothetical protein DL897_13280 [Thermoflavimicrobium daqui]
MKALAKRLLATVVLSIMLAALLSFVPFLQNQSDRNSDIAVFRPDSTILTEKNIVDFVKGVEMAVEIRRINLDGSQLLFELIQPSTLEDEQLYKDCFRLIKSSLLGLDNIKEVRLFIVTPERDSFFVQANQEHLRKDPKMENSQKHSYQTYLKQMFEFHTIPDNTLKGSR